MPPAQNEGGRSLGPDELGKYRLIRRIASGGMAEIYLARVSGVAGFEKNVVVKRILPRLAGDRDFVEMFLDEARIAATLQHPNIVQVYDAGVDGDDYFIAMEYLHGQDVRSIMKALAVARKPLPRAEALAIMTGVAAGLHYAHEKRGLDGRPLGIVHRDVTPQNVIVTYDGGVKLVDFGIAKAANRLNETRSGTLKGKLAYMSPEQCQGQPVDRRSDIYALGIMLYELTTNSRLYRGESEFAIMKDIVERPVPPPSARRSDFPAALEAVVMKALAKDPAQRYQSAREVQAELEGFARQERVNTSPIALSSFMQSLFGEHLASSARPSSDELAEHLRRRYRSGTDSDPSFEPGEAGPDQATRATPLRERAGEPLRPTPPRERAGEPPAAAPAPAPGAALSPAAGGATASDNAAPAADDATRVSLEDLLARGRASLPVPVALTVAASVLDALAVAHRMGLVYGALHPRTVLLDAGGAVHVADSAVGRAMVVEAARNQDTGLLESLAGYVAPERALGAMPATSSDVYAAGAMMFTMLAGHVPPGSLQTTPALEKVVQRALDPDLARRHPDAAALRRDLLEAIEDDSWQKAPAEEVAALVRERFPDIEEDVDAATEDLLSELAGASRARGKSGAEVDSETDDLLAALDGDPPTRVDDEPGFGHDPISELISLERRGRSLRLDSEGDEETPLPAPRPDHWEAGSVTRDGAQLLGGTGRSARAAEEAAAAIASLDDDGDDGETPPPRPAPSATAVTEPAPEVVAVRGGLGAGIWLATVALLLAVLGGVLYTQTDLFHPERARAKEAEREAALEAERRRLEAKQPRPGTIEVRSSPDGAAVWLLVGRTPVETMPLAASAVHHVRLEHEGYQPLDVAVGADAWPDGDEGPAKVRAELPSGTGSAPPAPKIDTTPTGREGRAPIRIESTPEGAQAWLLVGFTPEMNLAGIEAGRDYELKVLKDGYRPGFVVVKAADWLLGPEPDAGLRDRIQRQVKLAPR